MLDFIWVIGLPGSGKTTVIEELHKNLKGKEITIVSDIKYFLQLKDFDVEHLHHTHPKDENSFLITDSFIPDEAIKLTIKEALRAEGVKIIEIGRGLDRQRKVDLTIKRLVELIPSHIFSRSLFLYVNADYKSRIKRNLKRENNETIIKRRVNSIAMSRFFKKDDFTKSEKLLPLPLYVINNSRSKMYLKFKIRILARRIKRLLNPQTREAQIDKEVLSIVIRKAREIRAPFPCWDVYALALDTERRLIREASRRVSLETRIPLEHAERALIRNAKDQSLKRGTLYTSLEPCTFSNQKEGCAMLIAKSGFRKVVIGSPDFSPVNAYRTIGYFKKRKIKVTFAHDLDVWLGLKARFISPEDVFLNTKTMLSKSSKDYWDRAINEPYFNWSFARILVFNLFVFLFGNIPFWERKIITHRLGRSG